MATDRFQLACESGIEIQINGTTCTRKNAVYVINDTEDELKQEIQDMKGLIELKFREVHNYSDQTRTVTCYVRQHNERYAMYISLMYKPLNEQINSVHTQWKYADKLENLLEASVDELIDLMNETESLPCKNSADEELFKEVRASMQETEDYTSTTHSEEVVLVGTGTDDGVGDGMPLHEKMN